jgi:hypothetical protein
MQNLALWLDALLTDDVQDAIDSDFGFDDTDPDTYAVPVVDRW